MEVSNPGSRYSNFEAAQRCDIITIYIDEGDYSSIIQEGGFHAI